MKAVARWELSRPTVGRSPRSSCRRSWRATVRCPWWKRRPAASRCRQRLAPRCRCRRWRSRPRCRSRAATCGASGRNYHAHAKELAGIGLQEQQCQSDGMADRVHQGARMRDRPDRPGARCRTPRCPTQIDYEAELALVIGKGGKNISRADAMSHVFGYTIVNDVTARDVQMRHQQWDLGKTLRHLLPDGALDRHRRRTRRHATPACAAGSTASCARTRSTRRPDLRHPDPDRDRLARHHALPGRRHRHRHAGRRGHGLRVRRATCAAATWFASRSTASARSRTASSDGQLATHDPRRLHENPSLRFRFALAAAFCMAGAAALAQSADYPEPSRSSMVVPFPPGGVADTVARPVAEAMCA